MIYNQNEQLDVLNILAGIDALAEGALGDDFCVENIDVDSALVEAAVGGMRSSFPHAHGIEKASAFKKVAHFIVHFIYQSPIKGVDFKGGIDGHYLFECALTKFDPNAVFAFHFAIALLQGVVIRPEGCDPMKVENQIALSKHSYVTILEALTNLKVTPKEHFELIAILLEQLVYKTNKECQYKDYVFGPDWYWQDGAGVRHYTDSVADE